jgi:DNA-binding transcriptional MerR regulator
MLQLNYWISELAERTGVSTRTIRYYIEEGLLPQPEIQGKYAVFNDDYMVRLNLIKFLKDAYLPLKEIKRILDSLSVPETRDLVEKFEQNPTLAMSELMTNFAELSSPSSVKYEFKSTEQSSARDYIQEVLQRNQVAAREPKVNSSSPAPAPQVMRSPEPVSESWQRVELAPGIELNIRQPLSLKVRKQVAELIETARKIFTR